MPSKINLALFFHPERKSHADMQAIRAEIRKLDRRIATFVLPIDRPHRWTHLRLFMRPTVMIELDGSPKLFRPRRGTRLRQMKRGKLGPSAVIRDAGLPIPRYEVITPGIRLDPAEWGPYVVVKPDLGGRGAYVRIQKTGRVRYIAPEALRPDDPGRDGGARIVQKFIYTGPYPVSHRVVTLFGEPLLSARYDGRRDAPPLEGPAEFTKHGGIPIVAPAKGCTISLEVDPEMIALARKVHALFPKVPLLGQDFMRDAETGELYILEINPNGAVWSFSGRAGREMQKQFGLDFYSQFDAMPTAARVLVEIARRHAT